jgi:hypothetical protein
MRVSINTLCITKLIKMLDESGRRDMTPDAPDAPATPAKRTA